MKRQPAFRSILVVLLGTISGCGSPSGTDQKIPYPDNVSFSDIRLSILEPKCSRCHLDLTSYKGAEKYFIAEFPEQSKLYTSVRNDNMPPNGTPLNDEEKSAIYRWIEKGAAND